VNEAAEETGLVQQSQRGDRQAFAQIVHQTARLVYARIALDVADKHKAEDLTQEVFLAAWRSIGRLEKPESLRAWLLAIAASKVTDEARFLGRKKRAVEIEAGLENVPNSAADPAGAVESDDERNRALEALRSLPKEYRDPLSLRYLAGADYQTIGRQLALSNGALRGLLHRGLALLKKRLTE
jgi:RNA polymerase sigma factor (sigma-70 family)